MLHHVRHRLHHAPCVATRAHPAPLARISCRQFLTAFLAAPALSHAPKCRTTKTSASLDSRWPRTRLAEYKGCSNTNIKQCSCDRKAERHYFSRRFAFLALYARADHPFDDPALRQQEDNHHRHKRKCYRRKNDRGIAGTHILPQTSNA